MRALRAPSLFHSFTIISSLCTPGDFTIVLFTCTVEPQLSGQNETKGWL